MNEETTKQMLRELKTIRICAVVSASVFVLAFVVRLLNFHL